MPFTFSHPAIVLPLNYLPARYISLTGLVAGSVVPDFEYFIKMRAGSDFSHTIPGIFWFNLPLGIVLAFLFHNIVRNALIDNLPGLLKCRLIPFKKVDWNGHFRRKYVVVMYSVIIGASSHIFWDSFTDQSRFFVQQIPLLQQQIAGFPVYRIVQHVSTIVGGAVILFAIFRLPKTPVKEDEQVDLKYWGILFVISFVAVLLRIVSGISIEAYPHLIVTAISGFLIGLILAPTLGRLINNTVKASF